MENGQQRRYRFLLLRKKGYILTLFNLLVVIVVVILTVSRTPLFQGKAASSGQAYSSGSTDVMVDFGSRQNKAYSIPSQFLGVGGIGLGTAVNHDGSAVPQANFRLTKLGDTDYFSVIFPTAASLTNASQQDWTKFDTEMSYVVNYHLQPIITLAYTPSWLQPQNQKPPQPNRCLTNKPPALPSSIKPMYLFNGQDKGPQIWGQLAALMVAHVDRNFPQVHAMYEIWNEPDQAQFLCVPDGLSNPQAQQDRWAQYKAIFAAAAPQMKQQASKDGISIKIGGPALGYALEQQFRIWFPNLLNDPAIYPYLDFITYHRYLFGGSFAGSSDSLVTHAQDPALGVTAEYQQVAAAVRAGKQPHAATTPIYLDEYNMNSCVPNICRNDPTLAPLNNAMFLADVLNTVNDTGTLYRRASALPAGLAFYTWNIPSGNICMFGVIDAHMDCATKGGTIVPYPQYYTYELFGGSNYLNMTNGGYVANAVSSSHTGIFATGFYTSTSDCIVIVNTTSTSYTALNVLAKNPGHVTAKQAKVYTVQYAQHPSSPISLQQVNFSQNSSGELAAVHIPARTTVAISFTTG
jgi:Glycosyl hydrolases family 39